MSNKYIEVGINELAYFIFKNNIDNARIELDLDGIHNMKDMFFFCYDLFCKGLVILFGTENTVNINKISKEQFNIVSERLEYAGIKTKLIISDIDKTNNDINENYNDNLVKDLNETILYPYVNIKDIEDNLNVNLELHEYIFEIYLTSNLHYRISFELFHKV